VAHLARVKYPALGEGSLSWANVLSLDAGVGCSFSAGAAVALSDNEEWSLYGAPWLQPVATGRKSLARENGSIKPRPLPPAATSCRLKRMVRRGSTVRVRQRALAKALQAQAFALLLRCTWSNVLKYGTGFGTARRKRGSILLPIEASTSLAPGAVRFETVPSVSSQRVAKQGRAMANKDRRHRRLRWSSVGDTMRLLRSFAAVVAVVATVFG
jgi:hypothetical protein